MNAQRRLAAAAGAIILAQLAVCRPRLGLPFIDGRAHWNYDGATALLHAVHSRDATIRTAWDWAGVKEYLYDERGLIRGAAQYANHPIGLPWLFSWYSRLFGLAEWVPRSFGLLVALATSVALLLLLSAELPLAPAAGLTFLYTLLPLYYNYQDSWHHDAAAGLAMLATLLALQRGRHGAFLAAFAAMLQIDWPAYLLAGLLLVHLFRRERPLFWRALRWGTASAALNAALLLGLGATPQSLAARAGYRMAHDPGGLGLPGWAMRQAGFLRLNFGWAALAALALALAWLARRRAWRAPNSLTTCGAALLVVGCAWLAIFRNQSNVHHFIQWYLGLGVVLLLGAAAATDEQTTGRRWWQNSAIAAVCLFSFPEALALNRLIHDGNDGMAEDVAAIAAAPRRLIVADGLSGPRDWWLGAQIRLYTDPVYKARRAGRPLERVVGTFRFVDDVTTIDPARDAIVSLRRPETLRAWAGRLRGLGVTGLKPIAGSPSFVYLEPAVRNNAGLAKGARPR